MLRKDIRLLNKAIRKGERGEVSYSESELHYLKKKRRKLQEWIHSATISQNNGFGQYLDEQNNDD